MTAPPARHLRACPNQHEGRLWGMSTSHLSCSPISIATALKDAERICDQQGARMTPIRRRVLELLLATDAPAKAYDLLDQLGDEGAAKPPTIYRALDFLLEMGLAHKIESLNAYVACGHRDHRHSAVFLICASCHAAEELHADATISALEAESAEVDFALRSTVLEVRGICAQCRKAQAA